MSDETIYDVRFAWSGWEDGAEACDPPEPGKEWLTIYEDAEELAIIVHRPSDHPDSEKWRAQKERNAQRIVHALKLREEVLDRLPEGGLPPSLQALAEEGREL